MERKAKGKKRWDIKREGNEKRGGEERGKRKGRGRVASWLLGGWTPLLISDYPQERN